MNVDYIVDDDVLAKVVGESLVYMANAFNVPTPTFDFQEFNDPALNAVYIPRKMHISFYNVSRKIVSHEFGHHLLEVTHPEVSRNEPLHEEFAEFFSQQWEGRLYPIWRDLEA